MVDYTYFDKQVLERPMSSTGAWTSVVVAYNASERVRQLYTSLGEENHPIWAIHKEYNFADEDLPAGTKVSSEGLNEAEFVDRLLDQIESRSQRSISDSSIAVDITGFMRPELVCLVQKLKYRRAGVVDFLYAEPIRYAKKRNTAFSTGNVAAVRQVMGCEGVHALDTDADLLVVGTGYDDVLMRGVAEDKAHASKRLLYGFPPLALDMFQENVWRVSRASESIGASSVAARGDRLFAPANDPFVTADVLSRCVSLAISEDGVKNVYLSPLGTKAQVLGFSLYYALECQGHAPVSILLPFRDGYEPKTSEGMRRTWRYSIDMRSHAKPVLQR